MTAAFFTSPDAPFSPSPQTSPSPLSKSAPPKAHHQLKHPWSRALAQPAREFASTPITPIAGTLPPGLRGSLYRNGPARLQRGDRWVGHWFDGDGAVLGVTFDGRAARAAYRFVRTKAYVTDEAMDTWTQGSYGMTIPEAAIAIKPQPVRDRLRHPANTSVLALPDRVLALWEQGHPYALDPVTLETRGQDNFELLADNQPYAAHYKRDPETGEIFNFGVTYGLRSQLNVYRSDRQGRIQHQTKIHLGCLPLIHDCLLAGRYLVFFIAPVRLDIFPLFANQACFGDSLRWKPALGTKILVIDRENLEIISQGETDPFYSWHFGNGYVDESGAIVGDMVRYDDFSTNRYLQQVGLLDPQTAAPGTLWQFRLDPQTGKMIESYQLADTCGEFPIVAPDMVGRYARRTYMSAFRPGCDIARDLWSTIACFDRDTGEMVVADLGAQRYAIEPTYALDADDPKQGWIITVVYDCEAHRSEVWIYAADRIEDEPVCRLGLPGVVPMGFHGCWAPAVSR
jgi:carotenoid cleavage dioxygenase-like enzyme